MMRAAAVGMLLCLSGVVTAHAGTDEPTGSMTLTTNQIAQIERSVSDMTLDPEAVHFRNLHAIDTGAHIVCGELNAKNAFGGYVGYRPFLVAMDSAGKITSALAANTEEDIPVIIRACAMKPTPVRQPSSVTLIEEWRSAYADCRSGVSEFATRACESEDGLYFALEKLGWCFGHKTDEAQYLHDWHRCEANSWHARDLVPKDYKQITDRVPQ